MNDITQRQITLAWTICFPSQRGLIVVKVNNLRLQFYSKAQFTQTRCIYSYIIIEPGHSISYKIDCAPSEDSDQTARPRSLIRVFAVRMKTLWVLGYPQSALRRFWSDCADLILCWVHRQEMLCPGSIVLYICFNHLFRSNWTTSLPTYDVINVMFTWQYSKITKWHPARNTVVKLSLRIVWRFLLLPGKYEEIKVSADDMLKYVSYCSQKTGYYISCKLETICMICHILFSGKNKKNNHQFVACWISLESSKGWGRIYTKRDAIMLKLWKGRQ